MPSSLVQFKHLMLNMVVVANPVEVLVTHQPFAGALSFFNTMSVDELAATLFVNVVIVRTTLK
jgi:hypothetical protein